MNAVSKGQKAIVASKDQRVIVASKDQKVIVANKDQRVIVASKDQKVNAVSKDQKAIVASKVQRRSQKKTPSHQCQRHQIIWLHQRLRRRRTLKHRLLSQLQRHHCHQQETLANHLLQQPLALSLARAC
ncbi:Uncharacterised protein [Streptococcus equi subsp. equi]|nr:Uncharacterised protein [Streptococcus equi subsp. equi]